MPRAKRRCSKEGCKEWQPCRTHPPWGESKNPLPRNWSTIKKRLKANLYRQRGYLWCNGCQDRSGPFEVDHIVPRWVWVNHNLENLQLLCHKCHLDKTASDKQKYGKKRKSG